jgi:prepilin-type N-terminal cleavage/methylation domain-containing protein
MYSTLSRKRRFGFTLVEVLVTTVVVGVLAAVVIPAMVKQTTAGDSPRVASDLGSVKSAIEVFAQNVRPRMPGEILDLVDPITTVRLGIDGVNYTQTNVDKWKGPYLEWTADAGLAFQAVIFKSGGDASVVNGLFRCPGASTQNSYANASGDSPCQLFNETSGNDATDRYVSVKITGLSSGEFDNLNDIIDDVSETTDPKDSGILRQNASGTTFFLAVPYTRP